MSRFVLLVCFIVLLIAIDGEMTYDIFDFKVDTLFEWFLLFVVLAMVLGIYFVEQSRKPKR